MTWTNSLKDASLKSATSESITDGVFTYSEVLSMLQNTAQGGISTIEFFDLNTIYKNSVDLFSNDYVKTITYNVILGNPANATWWGGAKQISDTEVLGNLAAGSSQLHAERLIGKWFLGLDLPMPLVGGDTANSKAASGVYNYGTSTGALFVDGITATDINQGSAGTCYLLAALGAIAYNSPEYIQDSFIDNGNGTYGVRVYYNDQLTYTTVNTSLMVSNQYPNQVQLASDYSSGSTLAGEMWVSLLEKAYAQLNSQVNIVDRSGNDWNKENSIQAIEGGMAQPIKQFTNLNYDLYSLYNYYNPYGQTYSSSDPGTHKQAIIEALASGAIGWLASFKTYSNDSGQKTLVASHAHMVLGYNATTDKFIIRNPWGGVSSNSSRVIQFEMAIEEFWNAETNPQFFISEASATSEINYNYSLLATASTSATAVTEGEYITYTVTRDGSGTESTIYFDLSSGTAGTDDYVDYGRFPVTFEKHESSKRYGLKTYKDSKIEGIETYSLNLYNSRTDVSPVQSLTLYIKDIGAPEFGYTLSSSAQSTNSAVLEGEIITFTITRDGTGSESTIYLNTAPESAADDDFVSLKAQAVTFNAYETTKTIDVKTIQDGDSESVENFRLNLTKNPGDTIAVASALGHIKDSEVPYFDYTVTSSAGSPVAAVEEGGTITFTIARSGSGFESTVFIATENITAATNDYTGLQLQPITFSKNQKIVTVQIETSTDEWLDTTEYFNLNVYRNETDKTPVSYGTGFIKESTVTTYDYTITNDATENSPATEGQTITFRIERSGTGTVSTVYVSTDNRTATGDDFVSVYKQAVEFASHETVKTFSIETTTDTFEEEVELFELELFRNKTDPYPAAYSEAYITNKVTEKDYNYTITSTSSAESPATEGEDITFTITRDDTGSASTVYLYTGGGTADDSGEAVDYKSITNLPLTFSSFETEKTVTITTYKDSLSESDEYFWLDLYKTNDTDVGYSAYAKGVIKDDSSSSDFTYTVSSNSTISSAVEEGGIITFTITRSGTGSSSTVYLSTSGGTADFEGEGIDYEPLDKAELTFGAYETSKTISVTTYTDSVDENKEYFWLDLYETYGDAESGDYAAYASGYLKNVEAQTDYSYTITSNADKDNPVPEDNYVTFTITRSGTGSESAVYVKTIAGTASDDGNNPDYSVVNRKIEFESFETTKTVKVRTWADSIEEGNEYFYFELYKSYADLQSDFAHTYASGGIKDWVSGTEYGYTITSSATTAEPALEGNSITFMITRSGSGTASTVYIKTLAGLTSEQGDEKDYEPLDMVALDFAAFETVKTVTVDTVKDSRVEGYETLYLLLFKNYSDYTAWLNEEEGKLGSWALGVISDREEVNPYSYTLESSADRDNPVAEGSPITFTINRDGSGESSFVYLRTGGGTAERDGDDRDYAGFSYQLVSFTKEETSKTITIDTYEDGTTESDEYFYAVLYKTFTDMVDDNYEAYTTGGIKEASGDSPTYAYSISNTATSDDPVTEGSTVTFTISRDTSEGDSTVYVSTSPGTAEASNFDYQAISQRIINFLDGDTTKTVTVETLKDEKVEDTEYFWLLLFKNLADAESGSYASYAAANIKDAPVETAYTYTVTSDYSFTSPAEEGTSITFTITRDGSDSASTVYVSTNAGTAKSSSGDYEDIKEKAVVFNAGETEKTVTVATYVDSESEEAEYFHLLLYKTLADSAEFDYASYAEGGIKDLSEVVDYGYSITSNSPSNSQITEGGSIAFTITRDGSGSPSTVFVSTHAATASSEDYKELKEFPVNFSSDEVTKTVTVETLVDTVIENEKAEYFHLLLYKSISDSQDFNYAAHRAAYIRDAVVGKDYDYTITRDTALVLEGGVITFTIIRDDSGTPSTVYVRTRYNTADSEDDDYLHVDLAIEFAADEVSKEVKVKTWSDTKAEGDEYFNINLYKTLADQEVYNWSTYSGAWIRDADFGYSIVGSSELHPDGPVVAEGSPLTITVTRSGAGQATTVYLKIVNLTAIEAEDFATMTDEQLAVSFAADENTKTIQINTFSDTKSEETEFFAITLYRNKGDYASDSTSYINSLVAAIVDNTLASSSATSASYSLVSALPTTLSTQSTASQLVTNQTATSDQGATVLLGLSSSFHGHTQGMFKNDYAFAAIDNNGKVVVWGDAVNGGSNSAISDDLTNVVTIASNSSAFAAVKQDGSVVTWGDSQNGGNISDVSSSLNGSIDTKEIFSTKAAFAALRSDGSVVTWGDDSTGGDSQSVVSHLNGSNGVIKIASNMSAFAAIHTDGSVTTWGFSSFGGDSSPVSTQLDGSVNVAEISSTGSAFAALREDGSVITWGNQLDGGDSSTVSTRINGDIDVTSIHSTTAAFAVIRTDGSVVTWGDINNGGDSSAISSAINGTINITSITATDSAFAALRSDGSVITWGNSDFGGDSSGVIDSLNGTINVVKIIANKTSFAALKEDGSVVAWGYSSYGGDLGDNASKLNGDINVISITANDNAFAAIRADGSVVAWGGFQRGGDSSLVETEINGAVDVIRIFSTSTAFSALRSDGSLVTWGDWRRGGDSTSISAELESIVSLSSTEITDAPSVTIDAAPSFFGSTEDSFINTTGKISASDPNEDTLLYNLIGGSTTGEFSSLQGTYGTLKIDTKSGDWDFSPNDVTVIAFSGRTSETFQVNVSDGILSVTSPLQVDIVVGKQGNGTSANDFIVMKGENTDVDGGLGIDTALYSGSKDNYQIAINDGLVSIVDSDGNDSFKNIERIGFSDLNVALDLDGNAGQAAKFLGIMLGPSAVSNTTYTGLVIDYLDRGVSYESLMQIGLDAVLGADATSRSVVGLIYRNLAGSEAPESILSEYSAIIDSGSMTAVGLTMLAADHPINETNVDLVGLSQTGLDYLLV